MLQILDDAVANNYFVVKDFSKLILSQNLNYLRSLQRGGKLERGEDLTV